jgi:nucleoid DNA-binding protein
MADLNRQDIISGMMAEVDGLSHRMAAASLEAAISCITKALAEHQSVIFSDFGKFGVRHRRKRQGTHPHTQEPIQIPSIVVPYFSPSPTLKRIVKRAE